MKKAISILTAVSMISFCLLSTFSLVFASENDLAPKGTGENAAVSDGLIASRRYFNENAKAVHRNYDVATGQVSQLSGDISGTPLSNLFNDNTTGDLWTQNVALSDGYYHMKPFIMFNFQDNTRYVITKVEIWGRGDKANWPTSIKVAMGENTSYFNDIFSTEDAVCPEPATPYVIDLSSNTYSGSWFGLELSGNNLNEISELKIYGHVAQEKIISRDATVTATSYPSMAPLTNDGADTTKLGNGVYVGEMWMGPVLTDGTKVAIKYDWAEKQEVSQVRFFPRNDGYEGFPTGYTILSSEDGVTYTEVASATGIAHSDIKGRAIWCTLDTPIETAHLAVVPTGGISGANSVDMLSELEVMGRKPGEVFTGPLDGDTEINDEGLTKIPSSAFEVKARWRNDVASDQTNPNAPLSNLFDENMNTMWYPKDPVSPDYYSLKPFIEITFKDGKEYRIDKVRIHGRVDEGNVNAQYPESIKVATSADGSSYTDISVLDGINIGTRPSVSFTYTDVVTKYLGIEVSEGWMNPPLETTSCPMITEIAIFGEEIDNDSDEGLTQIPSSAFDVYANFRGQEKTEANKQEKPEFPLSNLVDGDMKTFWFPLSAVSAGDVENYKPFIYLDFKDGKQYRIDKIRIYGRADEGNVNAQFPESVKVATSADGTPTSYTDIVVKDNIDLGDKTNLSIKLQDVVTKHLAIEVNKGWVEGNAASIPMISEIVVFGEEIVEQPEDGDEVIDDEGLNKLDSSLFDVSVSWRGQNNDLGAANLFDGDLNNVWAPSTPVSPGYYDLKPFIKITFKDGKQYRIDKIRFYGQMGDAEDKNAQFPQTIKIATSKDGTAYTDVLTKENINMVSRDSISFTPDIAMTQYLGIQVSEGWIAKDDPNTDVDETKVSLPKLSEIVIFGEEVEVVDNNNLNNPDAEEHLDKNYVTDTKNDNITVIGKIEEVWG